MPYPEKVDWSGSDVNFVGSPRWYSQAKEDNIRRLEALSHKILHPYGMNPEQINSLIRQKEALEQQAKLLDSPFAIPLSVTGTSQKVLFTPAELYRVRNDERLAQKLYETTTGIPNPPKADVEEFRRRIIFEFPHLDQLVEKQHQFEANQRQEREDFFKQEMADRENIERETHSDLSNLRRDYAWGRPTGFSVYDNRAKYGLDERRASAIDNLLDLNGKLKQEELDHLPNIIPDAKKREQFLNDVTQHYPLTDYDPMENLRYENPFLSHNQINNQNDDLHQLAAYQAKAHEAPQESPQEAPQPGAAYADQPLHQPAANVLNANYLRNKYGFSLTAAQIGEDSIVKNYNGNFTPENNKFLDRLLRRDKVADFKNEVQQQYLQSQQAQQQAHQQGGAYAGQPLQPPQQQPAAPRGAFNKLMHGAVQILRDKGHLPPRPGAPAPTVANPIDAAANLMQQQQALPEMNPYANAENQYMLPEANLSEEEALLRRASVPLKMERLGEQHGRVAPTNQLHEQAQRMMQRTVNSDEDAFENAQAQLEEAQRHNIRHDVSGHVREGIRPTHQMLDPYMQSYKERVIDPLREEAKINFLEEIMPHVKGQFAASGAYHSGARQNELRKFAEKTQNQLMRDIGRLYHQGQESAYAKANEQNERQMQAAQIMGNATKAQQEAHIRNAEARQNQGVLRKESKKHDIAAISQFANAEQVQKQNEMNAKQQAYLESQMEEPLRLERYTNALAGIPSPTSMQINAHRAPAPTPPSAFNAGIGLAGQLFNLKNQSQNPGFSHGGNVNNRYATPEGLVNTAVNEYKQFANSVEPQKYDQEIEDLTSGFKNYRIDPIQNWVQHVSAQMLANNREDPLSNVGRGAIVAEENMMKHRDSMLASREKAANLYGAMNESRRNQQQLIGDYTQKYAANSETRRHNSAMEALKKQENEIKRLKNSATNALGTSINPSTGKFFMSKEQEKQFYKRDSEMLTEFKKEKDEVEDLSKRFNLMKNASENLGSTGPIAGADWMPHYWAAGGDDTAVANRRLFEAESVKNLFNEMQKINGVQSDDDREVISKSVLSLKDRPETIKQMMDVYAQALNRAKHSIAYKQARVAEGATIEQADNEWKKWVNENPLFEKEKKAEDAKSKEAQLDKELEKQRKIRAELTPGSMR